MTNKADPRIIIFSDIHLGALGSKPRKFEIFLKDIHDEVLSENLKAIIIAGDFFDLIMRSPQKLMPKCKNIYDKLYSIQEKGIKIINLLGNHEISVEDIINSSGQMESTFDDEFSNRKLELVKDFGKWKPDYLKVKCIAQYALLTRHNNNEGLLYLFDSLSELKDYFQNPVPGRYRPSRN